MRSDRLRPPPSATATPPALAALARTEPGASAGTPLRDAIVLAAILTAAAILSACGGDPATGIYADWSHETETHGDTTVMRTLEGSVWGDTMVLVPDVAIGEVVGEEPYMFGMPWGVVVDPAGALYVLDRQAREVRVFDREGRHLRSFGREGEGPGEFRNPDAMRILDTGELVVRDNPNARISLFSTSGAFLDSWRLNIEFQGGRPIQGAPGGTIAHPTARRRGTGSGIGNWEEIQVLYRVESAAVDTVLVPLTGFEAPYIEVSAGGGVSRSTVPFTAQEAWVALPDGSVATGISDRYAVTIHRPNGSLLRIERVVDDRIPVDPGHAAVLREQMTQNFRNMDPSWRWSGADIPRVKSVFWSLQAGEDGTLWVIRNALSIEEPNPNHDPANPSGPPATRWVQPHQVADVFDAEGRYLGPVRMPRVAIPFHRGAWLSVDEVIFVTTHEMGHEQIVRHRLVPASEADSHAF